MPSHSDEAEKALCTVVENYQDHIRRLKAALKPFADEPLSTEPEHNRTRLFSFADHDEKIRRAREALSH